MSDAMSSTYLCGAIQDAKGGGVEWREKIGPRLVELGIEVLDPTVWELDDFDGDMKVAQGTLEGWVRSGNWEKWDAYMDKIMSRDMKAVRRADFLIVLIDTDLRMGGTLFEIAQAIRDDTPLYVVCYDPWTSWNSWTLREIRKHGKIFESWGALLDFVETKYGKKR